MKSSNPPTPLFPMETKDKDLEVFTRKVQKAIIDKIGDFPQEAPSNCMSVSSRSSDNYKNCYYIPHNYRLYFDFNTEGFVYTGLYKTVPHNCGGFSSVLGFIISYKLTNHNSTHIYKFDNATIWVRKSTITVCNKIDHKKVFTIPFNIHADKVIKEIILNKDLECKGLLSAFIKSYGGSSSYNILNRHSEDKVFNDLAIDSINPKAKFTNEVGKKVYNEHNFEFSGSEYASNYIVNRSIENIAPELANELKANREILRYIIDINKSTSQVLKDFTKYMSCTQITKDPGIINQKILQDYIR